MASLQILLMLTASGGIPPLGQSSAADRAALDLWQTVQACRLLQSDATLARHNIGVRVRGRVAVLWGPVPSGELALRAEARLRTMFELTEVRNEMFVLPEDSRIPGASPHPDLPQKLPPQLPPTPRPFL